MGNSNPKIPVAQFTEQDGIRFWSKVDKSGNCWQWVGAVNRTGYGAFRLYGATRRAHRVAYEKCYLTPIPEGMEVCHRCDNPACVRPSHLFLGTHGDNMRDMSAKGRNAARTPAERKRRSEFMKRRMSDPNTPKINWRLGEDNKSSKLTENQVREIRRRYAAKENTRAELAKEFGVCVRYIGSIVTNRSWRHVE